MVEALSGGWWSPWRLAVCLVVLAAAALVLQPPSRMRLLSAWQHSAGNTQVPRSRPRLPWVPILSETQLRRGLSYYGSGQQLEKVAAKLLAREPIVAVTIGSSVTAGHTTYVDRFFEWINTNFPHKQHKLVNSGIPSTGTDVFAACIDRLVPADADLVVVEFSGVAYWYTHVGANSSFATQYEQLLRKLLRRPQSPALLLLHHYAWYYAKTDGLSAGAYYHTTELQFSTLGQYYDIPQVSVRTAVWHEMRQDIAPFKVSAIGVAPFLREKEGVRKIPAGIVMPAAPEGNESQYFYQDKVHPATMPGAFVLAELLASLMSTAMDKVAVSKSTASVGRAGVAASSSMPTLPPPMIPSVVDQSSSTCLVQESFRPVVVNTSGFIYTAQRPDRETFTQQKWGWMGTEVGAWAELQLSTVMSSDTDSADEKAQKRRAWAHLGHVRSYEGMGVARVTCVSGCKCPLTFMDCLWSSQVSLTQMLPIFVTQHPECRIKVAIIARNSPHLPDTVIKNTTSSGNKVQLNGLIVSLIPVIVRAKPIISTVFS